MTILMITTAVIYVLLLIWKRNSGRVPLVAGFVISSFALRYAIDIQSVRDFSPYFESFQQVKFGSVPVELFIEPYRLAVFKLVLLFGDFDSLSQITAIYYAHFVIVTIFFVWLAGLKDVTFEVKLILFLSYYPVIAFVWLRAGMAYVVGCYLFYAITTGRFRVLQFLLPAIHSSSLPFLGVMMVKNLRPLLKGLFIIASALAAYLLYESNYFQYLATKLERYAETSDRRTSDDLLILHAVNILVFIYLALINSRFRKNFAVLTLMAVYIVQYAVNPVTGLRVFPFVLIASIAERISFQRHQFLTFTVCGVYLFVYMARFDQIFL